MLEAVRLVGCRIRLEVIVDGDSLLSLLLLLLLFLFAAAGVAEAFP